MNEMNHLKCFVLDVTIISSTIRCCLASIGLTLIVSGIEKEIVAFDILLLLKFEFNIFVVTNSFP